MSRGKLAGSPISFRCAKCRLWKNRTGPFAHWCGWHDRVRLTGKKRPYFPPQGSALGTRSDTVLREYVCTDCGHVGWSNHIDLKSKEKRS